MNTDKLTKCLLAMIAIALWVIAMNPWLRPMPVSAQDTPDLSQIESDLGRISRGTCTNSKIC
jgi:hypothetical protein